MRDDDFNPLPSIDLHRMTAAAAVRALSRELHAARVRRLGQVLVITGRGYGNALQAPVLRSKIEEWLRSDEARRQGVRSFKRVHRDGALEVQLDLPGIDRTRTA